MSALFPRFLFVCLHHLRAPYFSLLACAETESIRVDIAAAPRRIKTCGGNKQAPVFPSLNAVSLSSCRFTSLCHFAHNSMVHWLGLIWFRTSTFKEIGLRVWKFTLLASGQLIFFFFFFFLPELDINAGAIALVSEDHVVSQWCKDTQTPVWTQCDLIYLKKSKVHTLRRNWERVSTHPPLPKSISWGKINVIYWG